MTARDEAPASRRASRNKLVEPGFAQAPRHGQVPVMVGSGESTTIVWVPADTDAAHRAMVGRDGVPPEARVPG